MKCTRTLVLYRLMVVLFLFTALAAPLVSFADTACETFGVSTGDDNFGNGDGTGAAIYQNAGAFTASASENLNSVTATLKKSGSPSDGIQLHLQANSSGHPSGVDLAVGSIAASSLTTSAAVYTVTFAAPYAASSGTIYWIVAGRSGGADNSNYYLWKYSVSGAPTGLHYLEYSSNAWNNAVTNGTFFGGLNCSAAITGAASSTTSSTGYLPSEQEDLFMFGLIIFLLATIAFKTLFFTV